MLHWIALYYKVKYCIWMANFEKRSMNCPSICFFTKLVRTEESSPQSGNTLSFILNDHIYPVRRHWFLGNEDSSGLCLPVLSYPGKTCQALILKRTSCADLVSHWHFTPLVQGGGAGRSHMNQHNSFFRLNQKVIFTGNYTQKQRGCREKGGCTSAH